MCGTGPISCYVNLGQSFDLCLYLRNKGTRLAHQLKDALYVLKSELDVTVKRTR